MKCERDASSRFTLIRIPATIGDKEPFAACCRDRNTPPQYRDAMITARRNPPRIAVRWKEGRSIPHRTVTCDTGKPYFSVLAVETFCDISMDKNKRVRE
jgi:hypothetical protein